MTPAITFTAVLLLLLILLLYRQLRYEQSWYAAPVYTLADNILAFLQVDSTVSPSPFYPLAGAANGEKRVFAKVRFTLHKDMVALYVEKTIHQLGASSVVSRTFLTHRNRDALAISLADARSWAIGTDLNSLGCYSEALIEDICSFPLIKEIHEQQV